MLSNIQLGEVYLVSMSQSEGITPQEGQLTRDKFFIVLGFDDEGNIYGGVVINSQINRNLPREVTDYYMPIRREKYPFLKYNSFVNCAQLKPTTLHKLNSSKLVGKISTEDHHLIVGTIIESPHETKARLIQFGLIPTP